MFRMVAPTFVSEEREVEEFDEEHLANDDDDDIVLTTRSSPRCLPSFLVRVPKGPDHHRMIRMWVLNPESGWMMHHMFLLALPQHNFCTG